MQTTAHPPLAFLKRLREPATFWTDCALALWSGWLAWALARHAPADASPVTLWWVGAFAISAIAAAAGAIHHGLGHELRPAANQRVWQFTLLSLVGSGLCLLHVAANLALAGGALIAAQAGAWLVAIILGIVAVRIGTFATALFAYGQGLIAVLVAAFMARSHFASLHLVWLLTAFALSVVAAGIQHFRIGFGPRFNHNDLYHVVQFAAQGGFYLTALATL